MMFFLFFIMCLRLERDRNPPPPDCNNQLSPHGGHSNHERQRQQRHQREGEPIGGWSNPSVAIVSVPLGPVSVSCSWRLCGVGDRVTRGFVGGRVRPVAWPIIVVPLTMISTPWATAFLTWNNGKAIKTDLWNAIIKTNRFKFYWYCSKY